MKETNGTVNHRKVGLGWISSLVNNGSMTVSLRRGLLQRNSLIPGKGKSKKVTLGIRDNLYHLPRAFPVGEVSKEEQEKSFWSMIQVLTLCFP